MEESERERLKVLSARIRLDVLTMLKHCGYGHLGGSFSICELMSVLYGEQMHYDPSNPQDPDRDMVVLSKGHCGPAWYSALAEAGFFDREVLNTLNQGGTILPSHPDRLRTPGVDATSGSLGQGTSVAAGLALGMRMLGRKRYVYLIVGDGELDEGQCWEAFQFIASYGLDNCIVLIDDNKKQLDGYTDDVIKLFDIAKKMEAFGFYTQRVKGDDEAAISEAIDNAKAHGTGASAIVLDTVKGQGVPYFEKLPGNHSVKFNNDEINAAADEAIAKLTAYVGGAR